MFSFWSTTQTPLTLPHASVASFVSVVVDSYTVWEDTFVVPAVVASTSAVLLLTHLCWNYARRGPGSGVRSGMTDSMTTPSVGLFAGLQKHIAHHGGGVIFGFRLVRVIACLALLALSLVSANISDKWGQKSALSTLEGLSVTMCLVYLYAAFLALVTVSAKRRWSQVAIKHLNSLLVATLFVYIYRDIFPIITYHRVPLDIAEGWVLWAKITSLLVGAAIVPLFVPRQYIPVDPKNPMPVPNAEQTASIFATMFYFFMDPTIFAAYRTPHLPYDQLPPLSDYDYAANLKAQSFKHLETTVSNKRHLFFGLMWVFRIEYLSMAGTIIVMAVSAFLAPIGINRLLDYLEHPGEEPTIKPWFWILWLVAGPIMNTAAFQWNIFLGTRTVVRCEALITQLVFEHALRIRVKAETAEKKLDSGASTPDERSVPPTEPQDLTTEPDTDAVSQDEILPASSASIASSAPSKGKENSTLADEPEKKDNDNNLVGKITNLVTTDLGNITESRNFLFAVLLTPIEVTLGVIFLYQVLGWSAFVGMGVMVVSFPLPGYVAKLSQTVQQQRLKRTDSRVQVVTETMNVLRMIKLFGWEKQMDERVAEKREEELNWVWKKQMLELANGIVNAFIPMATMVATYASVEFYMTIIMKEELNASKVFSSMTVFDLLEGHLHMIFWSVSEAIAGKVSLDRVNAFLHETELLDSFTEKSPNAAHVLPADIEANGKIGFSDAVFAWSSEKTDGTETPSRSRFTLKIEGEMLFKPGCINLVVGPTGSGKTSLLMALLGEMHFIPSGPSSYFNLPRANGISYASQESWVQNETIKDNILFGARYDPDRYKKVIYQCALERDLELFEAGDATEVGEKGLTLSGGQKARITLARAIYANAEIVLLDDVLAALDVHTAKWIVDKCLRGDLITGRTIIMVTHNVAMAQPIAKYVISMGSNGHIHNHGPVSEALATDEVLADELDKDQQVLDQKLDEVDPSAAAAPPDGKLIVAEEMEEGHVGWDSLKLYFKGMGGNHTILFFALFLGGIGLNDLLKAVQTWFLGYWAGQYTGQDASQVDVFHYLAIFCILIVIGLCVYAVSFVYYTWGAFRASRVIHKQLVESVLGTTLRWLDVTPTSRVIARCTVDIRSVDGPISQSLWRLLEMSMAMLVKFGAVVLFTPPFLLPGILVGCLGIWCGQMYMAAQLSVKREMSNAKAPVLGHFGAVIAGLTSIRAYGAQNSAIGISLGRIDKYTRTARTFYNLNRWVSVRIDALGVLFAAALAYYLIYFQKSSSSNTGFSLNMAIGFAGMILWWVREINDFEIEGNSLERIRGYVSIEQEPKPTASGVPPAYWPASGELNVEKLSSRYSADGPKVLHDISFHVKAGERVGIVGRTGSGKSSLTLSLLRCILTEGNVVYDGIPTSSINLDALRSNITIIPQVPELLTGTLRKNLDLFEQYDDATLNSALRAAGLFSLQNEMDDQRLTLDSDISSGGGNLSVGQRQILALARAIVRGSKLLILDEATSAIDYKTDTIIQASLRNELPKDTTLLTVAHRLQTIMDADKIMVLDAGRIVEFDSPKELLKNKNGMLRALVDESGDKDALYKMAQA
ncbi:hypothetical protein C8R43DRAFT_1112474 [Mycena crocata]|nr:hypothetical protein C8R43DRAFT_1112474 [Mycena crocata]